MSPWGCKRLDQFIEHVGHRHTSALVLATQSQPDRRGVHVLVTHDENTIEATPLGRLFVRNVAMCWDEYYWARHQGSDKQIFSRTV